MKELTLFLRENNLRAGISMVFSPLTKIAQYYEQASLALEYGLHYNPFIWLYPFKDYRYHYLMELIQQHFPDIYSMVPEMNAILENDRNNGTNYFETLKCYLENDRNMLQAAKKLNVHRTTLAYRLEKISIIMNTNVDDKNLDPLLRLFFHFCEILHQK